MRIAGNVEEENLSKGFLQAGQRDFGAVDAFVLLHVAETKCQHNLHRAIALFEPFPHDFKQF